MRSTNAVPRAVRLGVLFSLAAVLFGFGLGGLLGVAEDSIKGHLNRSAAAVLDSVYRGDAAKKDAVVSKSWSYLKRAHLHGGAIGAASLGSIAVLILLCRLGAVEGLSSIAFGAGALLYPLFWLLAGFKAPALGSTDAAKESLSFLALPGAGLCILGLCGIILSVVRQCCAPSEAD